MTQINLVIIGVGAIGTKHAHLLYSGIIEELNLYGLCVRNDEHRKKLAERYPGTVMYKTAREVFQDEKVSAVLIATPHLEHDLLAEEALRHGKHVLVEKPLAVDGVSAKNALAVAAKYPDLAFGIMFNQRTLPVYQKIQQLLAAGDLGPIQRISWVRSDWFRPQSYFDRSSWRGTWQKEGGGLLLNQAAHVLDLWQQLFGMPQEVSGFAEFGKYRNIEVDDEVTAVFKYSNGVTGTFFTSVAEAPGTNRLEIVTSFGKLRFEHHKLHVFRVNETIGEFNDHFTDSVGGPTYSEEIFDFVLDFNPYQVMLQNFADSILKGEELIAPAAEGLNSLQLANAIYLSTWEKVPVHLPIDDEVYVKFLGEHMKKDILPIS